MKALTLLALCFISTLSLLQAAGDTRLRLIVLTDIGGDPDDQQSLVRLCVYANEFDLVGLIATSNLGHNQGRTQPQLIREIVQAYGKVRDNLALHASGYPTAETLLGLVHEGRSGIVSGHPDFGPGRETDGSRHIISIVDAPDPRPVWITIWGGANDLAQALWSVRVTRSAQETARFVAKLHVYAIDDQDGTGAWIRNQFPSLRYLEPHGTNASEGGSLFRGMYQNTSHGNLTLVRQNLWPLVWAKDWITPNLTQMGPLGALYPANVSQNPNEGGNQIGVKEGDTPSWFYLLPNGLGSPDQPTWGSWGGRLQRKQGEFFTDAEDNHWSGSPDASLRRKWTVARWREAYQNDFAARMAWTVKPPASANHPPQSPLPPYTVQQMDALPGQKVQLSASGWSDPDPGQKLTYRWWFYQEAGTRPAHFKTDPVGHLPHEVTLEHANSPNASFVAPYVVETGTIHFIAEVTDNGTPPLTRYQRCVVTVSPNHSTPAVSLEK